MTADVCCARCGGTVLAPTRGGVPRGTCHCPPNAVAPRREDPTREIIIRLTAWVQAYEQHWKQAHGCAPPPALAQAATEGEAYVELTSGMGATWHLRKGDPT